MLRKNWFRVAMVALFAAALALRLSALWTTYVHPDEPIPLTVVPGMIAAGSLDTNWHLYPTGAFKWPIYQFSSYLIMLAALAKVHQWIAGAPPGLAFFRVVSMVAGAMVIPATMLIGTLVAGRTVALIAGLLTLASVQLFQDDLYARPEAIFTLLFMGALAVSFWRGSRPLIRLTVASALIGLLIACKVSALSLAPLPFLLFCLERSWSWRAAVVSGAAMLAGCFAGEPYAFIHPDVFLFGLGILKSVYSTGSGPHGIRAGDGTDFDRFVYLLGFLAPTLGIATLLSAAWATAVAVGRRDWSLLPLAATAFGSLIVFGVQPFFIERNFSHVLPLLFILAASGAVHLLGLLPRKAALVAAPLLVAAMLWPGVRYTWVTRFYVLSGAAAQRRTEVMVKAIHDNPGVAATWADPLVYGPDPYKEFKTYLDQTMPDRFIVGFAHLGDRYSQRSLEQFLRDFPAERIAVVRGPFSGISTSTMQAYLGGDYIFYRATKRSHAAAP